MSKKDKQERLKKAETKPESKAKKKATAEASKEKAEKAVKPAKESQVAKATKPAKSPKAAKPIVEEKEIQPAKLELPEKPVKVEAVEKPSKKASGKKSVTSKATKAEPEIVITNEEISLRAYFIAERRHKMGWPGNSESDWIEAERQLRQEAQRALRSAKA